jgi:hypothetical protein
MTDLQIGLLVIGAAAIAGVLIYNRVQERATRRDAQRVFGSDHVDVLLDERQEPEVRREPTIEVLPTPPAVPTDPRIDYIVELQGTSLSAIHADWAPIEQRFPRRALIGETGDGKLQVALQMLGRKGVIAEAELVDFRSQLETIAAAHGATVAAAEIHEALHAAKELDRACADVDVQIALHVLGVTEVEPGSHPFQVRRRADGVTLLLDIPRTADFARAYEAMVTHARALGGRLVDDNANTLDDRALAAIRVEVHSLGTRLTDIGIEPGSPLALRLFS